MAKHFTSMGRALFALDLKGHGYSDGERALLRKHTEIVGIFSASNAQSHTDRVIYILI